MKLSRRGFVAGSLLSGAFAARAREPGGPKAIASANGLAAVEKAVQAMLEGADTLDAAIAGVNLVEDDPKETSVGLGGLPNEEGIVELDSAVMHGPSAGGGSVASLRNIRNPSRVAKLVMERTDHVLLVGEGALRFARAHGFREENLLTDQSRKIWLHWKETLSENDDWLPPADDGAGGNNAEHDKAAGNAFRGRKPRPTGTIHLSTLDGQGNLSSCTTTSGLAFKIAGRVGDSPILGAGLYTDNDVGSAGSTGRGEANLLTCASFLIVEEMRRGQTPVDACLAACRRIAATTKAPRLLDERGRPRFNVKFYALDKQGRHGSAALYAGEKYALADASGAKLLDSASLFDTPPPKD